MSGFIILLAIIWVGYQFGKASSQESQLRDMERKNGREFYYSNTGWRRVDNNQKCTPYGLDSWKKR